MTDDDPNDANSARPDVKSLARALEGSSTTNNSAGSTASGTRVSSNPFLTKTPPKPPPKPAIGTADELSAVLAKRLAVAVPDEATAGVQSNDATPKPSPVKMAPRLPSRSGYTGNKASVNPFLTNSEPGEGVERTVATLEGQQVVANAVPASTNTDTPPPLPDRPALPPRPANRTASSSSSSSFSSSNPFLSLGPPSQPRATSPTHQTPVPRPPSPRYARVGSDITRPSLPRPDSRPISSAALLAAPAQQPSRRPPFLGTEISHKGTRSALLCRDSLVTLGTDKARVWILPDAMRSQMPKGLFEYGGKDYKGVSAATFVPAPADNPGEVSRYLWVGTLSGDIFCIDTTAMQAVDRRVSPTKQMAVTHLGCLGGGVLSEDGCGAVYSAFDNGLLLVWGRLGSSSTVSLREDPSFKGYGAGAAFSLSQGKPRTWRFPSKRALISPVGSMLWTTSVLPAKPTIDVYDLSEDALRFDVKRIDVTAVGAGAVAAIAGCAARRWVASAHEDNKLVIWDRETFIALRAVRVDGGRPTCLVFAEDPDGGRVWCGLANGRIAVYEVRSNNSELEVTQVSDFESGDSKVVALYADRASLLTTPGNEQRHHTLQIVSLGNSGSVKLWDGWLLRDRLDSSLRSKESSFSTSKEISIYVCSWNVGAGKPPDAVVQTGAGIGDMPGWRRLVLDGCPDEWRDGPDVVVFGLQEIVDLDKMPQQAKSFIKGTQRSLQQSGQGAEASRYTVWQDSLARLVRESFPASYDLVDTTGLVGLLLCTFVKGRDGRRFRLGGLSVESVKTGVGGLHGNKGAIMLRMQADDTSVAFVNCHLAAHQEKVVERNFDCASIANGAKFETLDPWTTARGAWDFAAASSGLTVGGGDGSMLMDHETIFWFGDLNYRIDLSRKEVMDAIARRDWGRLLERDQLAQQRPSSGAPPAPGPPSLLRNFDEAPIDFAPTFKFDAGSDNYDSSEKMRIPAYCDRVLHRGKQVRQRKYSSHVVRTSDHRPVSAAYEVGIRSVNAASREKEAGKLVQELWERWIPLGRKAAIDALREEARMCSRRN